MRKEVKIISGDGLFFLEAQTLKIIKKKEGTAERVCVNPYLNFDFPALRDYCEKQGIAFTRDLPERFFLEGGKGFYITSDFRKTGDREELRNNGFSVN